MIDEKQIYEQRNKTRQFRQRLGLAVLLCLFGVAALGGFLLYRHHHPISMEPVKVEQKHPHCPHPECIAAHGGTLERPTEYAPPVLAGLLLLYCAVVGIGSFVAVD